MGRLTIEQAIEYWKIFLDEIEELKATPGTDPEEWDKQEIATVAALEALVKQRHYEDLEEQNRLITLPCAVGDTVYVIRNKEVQQTTVFSINIETVDSGYYFYIKAKVIDGGAPVFHKFMFGKTAFLTKEEAEAKLAELKGE